MKRSVWLSRRSKEFSTLEQLALQIAGSWVFTPVAFLAAQLIGQGSNINVNLLIFVRSALAPIALFVAEVLVLPLARNRSRVSWLFVSQILLIFLSASFVSLFVYRKLLGHALTDSNLLSLMLPSLFLSVGAGLSALCSYLYFRILCHGKASKLQNFFVGSLPVLVTQLSVILLALYPPVGSLRVNLVCFVSALPSIVQFMYLINIMRSKPFPLSSAQSSLLLSFYPAMLFVIAISLLASGLQLSLAQSFGSFNNIVFLSLNILSTVFSALFKTYYVSSGLNPELSMPSQVLFALAIAFILMLFLLKILFFASLLLYLCLIFLICWFVAISRTAFLRIYFPY